MIRSYRAELAKLVRRRVLLVTAAVALLFAVAGPAVVLAAAPATSAGAAGQAAPSVEELAAPGGGTDVFRVAIAFTGTFLFVVFVGLMAAEVSRGTMRTMLLRQPRRVRLLAGKLAATLTFAAVTSAVVEVVSWVTARALAPAQGVDTAAWTGLDALGAAAGDFVAVLAWVTGYAVLGSALGIVLRSVPVALGVGIAWAGPVEHLLQDAWEPASRIFPGLLLEAFAAGGTPAVSADQALVTVAAHVVLAGVLASVTFSRRDVTT